MCDTCWHIINTVNSGVNEYKPGIWHLSCNIVPKNLRLEHLKNRVNTACCLLDSSLINAKFMSYNDRAPPPLTSTWRHARDSFSQAFPLHFCVLQVIKNWRRERPGNEAIHSTTICSASLIPKMQWYSLGMRLVCHYFHKLVTNFPHTPPPLLAPNHFSISVWCIFLLVYVPSCYFSIPLTITLVTSSAVLLTLGGLQATPVLYMDHYWTVPLLSVLKALQSIQIQVKHKSMQCVGMML